MEEEFPLYLLTGARNSTHLRIVGPLVSPHQKILHQVSVAPIRRLQIPLVGGDKVDQHPGEKWGEGDQEVYSTKLQLPHRLSAQIADEPNRVWLIPLTEDRFLDLERSETQRSVPGSVVLHSPPEPMIDFVLPTPPRYYYYEVGGGQVQSPDCPRPPFPHPPLLELLTERSSRRPLSLVPVDGVPGQRVLRPAAAPRRFFFFAYE